jgi:hypothetical protein
MEGGRLQPSIFFCKKWIKEIMIQTYLYVFYIKSIAFEKRVVIVIIIFLTKKEKVIKTIPPITWMNVKNN